MVVMPLTLNHIQLNRATSAGTCDFAEMRRSTEPVLVVSDVFDSQLRRARVINVGSTLNQVNGKTVKTLEDLRKHLNQV